MAGVFFWIFRGFTECAAVVIRAQQHPGGEWKERRRMLAELNELSERWFAAWLEKDAGVVERLMAEDYVYVGPEGLVLGREDLLGVIRLPSYRLDRGARSEVVVRGLGEGAAVVRHRYRGAGSYEGRSFVDDQRCVMVWERRSGEWRLVMEQCSFAGK